VRAENIKNYAFIDGNPLSGISYYRIKAVGSIGDVKYSSIARITSSRSKAELTVSPNPVQGKQVTISLGSMNKGSYTMSIINAAGQKVYSYNLGLIDGAASTTVQLPGNLQPGMYSILIHGGSNQLQKNIIIQ
jgi:hypothetical protein